jgi:hypothetical protein
VISGKKYPPRTPNSIAEKIHRVRNLSINESFFIEVAIGILGKEINL